MMQLKAFYLLSGVGSSGVLVRSSNLIGVGERVIIFGQFFFV